ncbi:kinase-like domain-containing protein [Mycena leptocephala]|nr:kinase-like domain-containing protein [Mycena leptocephala]
MGGVCCRPTTLFHFVLLRCVGKGAFGKERRLLEEIDHPFIVNLRYAFQDDENCFFVLDLMLGGDLRFHLERLGSLDEEVVRFYVAQLSSVQFLHDNNIMHRDLKPDNTLDERGNAHLTDFNIEIMGVAGSMAYMAPEILVKRGYSYGIDWWSLGVCAYELIFGRRPFRGRTNNDLTYSITKDPLKWRKTRKRSALLDRDPARRFGCKPNGEGFQELRRHQWFKTIDWDTLESKEQTPPFVPDAKKANFDASHELEELLLEDNPLKAKTRKANQENFSPEMRQMEEQFTSYDFKKMQRRSYFPQNQQLISTATATSSGMASSRPSTPANDLRMENGVVINGNSIHDGDVDAMRTERMIMTEKDYP